MSVGGRILYPAKGLEEVMFVCVNSHLSVHIVQPPTDCFVFWRSGVGGKKKVCISCILLLLEVHLVLRGHKYSPWSPEATPTSPFPVAQRLNKS